MLDTSKPMMSPKRPRIELKISITRTLTNLKKEGVSLTHTYQQTTNPPPPPKGGGGGGKGEGKEGAFSSTHKPGSAASASAALLPLIPTETPQMRLHIPTVSPAQKSAKPV